MVYSISYQVAVGDVTNMRVAYLQSVLANLIGSYITRSLSIRFQDAQNPMAIYTIFKSYIRICVVYANVIHRHPSSASRVNDINYCDLGWGYAVTHVLWCHCFNCFALIFLKVPKVNSTTYFSINIPSETGFITGSFLTTTSRAHSSILSRSNLKKKQHKGSVLFR